VIAILLAALAVVVVLALDFLPFDGWDRHL
jgi:hypothetical protein